MTWPSGNQASYLGSSGHTGAKWSLSGPVCSYSCSSQEGLCEEDMMVGAFH